MRLNTVLCGCAALALTASAAGAQALVINEIYYDGPGTDQHMFVEILGPPGTQMGEYFLIGVDGQDGIEYNTIPLAGMVIPADGYLVLGQDSGVPNVDYVNPQFNFENGPDQLLLAYYYGPRDYEAIDGICYGYSAYLECEGGTHGPDVAAGNSISRCPNGWDTDNNADDTIETTPTPGAPNDYPGGNPVLMTPCEAVRVDASGRPVHLGEWVHLTNSVLVLNDAGIFGPGMANAATDGECCLYLYDVDYAPGLLSGDEVDVIGTIGFDQGRFLLGGPNVNVEMLSGGSAPPESYLITTADLAINGEQYENCLIQINGLFRTGGDPWPAEGQDASITIVDGTGVEVTLFIDSGTNIDGTPPPGEPFAICGIAGQVDSTEPYTSGYQIIPRNLDDVNCGGWSPARRDSWGTIKRQFK